MGGEWGHLLEGARIYQGRQHLDRINNKLLKRNFVAFLNVDYSVD